MWVSDRRVDWPGRSAVNDAFVCCPAPPPSGRTVAGSLETGTRHGAYPSGAASVASTRVPSATGTVRLVSDAPSVTGGAPGDAEPQPASAGPAVHTATTAAAT